MQTREGTGGGLRVEVSVAGHAPATGRAASKRAAEQAAAARLLDTLNDEGSANGQ